ncbi:class I SAM-dependent methyltransferase [soil metagenome]
MTGGIDVEAFRRLLTPAGQSLLERVSREYVEQHGDALRTATVLRRDTDSSDVAAALTQVELRLRARAKLGDLADHLYFTSDGLEQATRLRVAEHRAARVALADPASVLDLGCGIGGDLLAFSRAGLTVAGIDRDALRVEIARANLDALGLGGALRQGEVSDMDLSGFSVVFADPARRSTTGRIFDVDGWSPPWRFVVDLLRRTSCVKVAPGIPHHLVPEGAEVEFVSDDGGVKEAVLWSAGLATVRRRATVIRASGLATLTEEDDPGSPGVQPIGRYLYEPDGAVIRAGLVTAVAAAVGGGLLDDRIAYVTANEAVTTPFARAYEVVEEVPFREKALRAALRERGIGRLTIKKRGVDVVPEQLRRRLALAGDSEATLVMTRVCGKGTALLVRPC